MKKKLFTITALITLVLAFLCIISMFLSRPDFVLFNMFGYEFGVNYTQHIELKLITVALMILLILFAEIKNEQQIES